MTATVYVGISELAVNRLGKCSSTESSSVSSPTKRYTHLRGHILVDTSEQEIRHRNVTLPKSLSKDRLF